jgi:hypothetical protein
MYWCLGVALAAGVELALTTPPIFTWFWLISHDESHDETPSFDHDGRPKRCRLSGPSPGDTPSISQYISSFN